VPQDAGSSERGDFGQKFPIPFVLLLEPNSSEARVVRLILRGCCLLEELSQSCEFLAKVWRGLDTRENYSSNAADLAGDFAPKSMPPG
jgi:hypothetical protein